MHPRDVDGPGAEANRARGQRGDPAAVSLVD